MKNKLIIASVIAFLIGDAEACVRARRYYRKQQAAMLHENEVLRLKLEAICTVVVRTSDGDDFDEIAERFDEMRKFIEIIE